MIDQSSLSARRAWIEIAAAKTSEDAAAVALRKESVDRNKRAAVNWMKAAQSLSARRAWIEIPENLPGTAGTAGRSPQGERG